MTLNRFLAVLLMASAPMNACIPIDIEDLPSGTDGTSHPPTMSPTELEETPTPGEGTPTVDVTASHTQTPSDMATDTPEVTPSLTATQSPTPTPTNLTATPTAPLNPTATPTTPPPTPTATPTPTQAPSNDDDGDGSTKEHDCDDNDPSQYPGAPESCNGEDDDCDDSIDEEAGIRTYPDADSDGYGDETKGLLECEMSEGRIRVGSDCDDSDPWRNPGIPFEYQDGIDNDCDLEDDEIQLANSSVWSTSGTEGNSWTGSSLIGLGDFDQDGYDDMAVGDSWGDGNRGRATIFYGQPEGAEPSSSDPESWILTGDEDLGQAGLALAAGDFNGDGIPDLAVGQPLANRVSLVFGDNLRRTEQLFLEDVATTVNAPRGGLLLFGNSLAAADMDGDGDDDLIIGAPGFELTGRVYILFGRGGLEESTAFNIEAEGRILDDLVGGSTEGYTAVTAGDLNNDGKEDVLVGSMLGSATLQGDSCDACGVVAIVYGDDNTSKIGTNSRVGLLVGQFEGSGLGWGVGSAGNINGDDYDDFIVGAPSYEDDDVEVGRAYVILGRSERYGETKEIRERAHIIIDGVGADAAQLGNLYSVGSPGDVNGDGYDDIWVGGVGGHFTGEDSVGVGALFMGYDLEAPDSPIYYDITDGDILFQGAIANGNFGSIGAIGDLNQDGYDDLLMGAYTAQVNNESQGQAYLFWGYPGSF